MPTAREVLQQVVWMGALATIHLFTLSLSIPAFASDIYQYIERDGTVSFTNVPNDTRYNKIAVDTPRPAARAPKAQRTSTSGSLNDMDLWSLGSIRTQIRMAPRQASNPWRGYQTDQRYHDVILRHASLQQLNPALVRAVIKAESGFDHLAVSRTGAMGLMQLMPRTAQEVGVYDPYDPEDNIGGGTRYLRYLLDRFDGNVTLALAAYNAGMHRVDRHRGVPPIQETREYVTKVLRFYRAFLSEKSSSPSTARASAISTAGASQYAALSASSIP
jgi:soluble lytic murein transglycosylase